MVTWSRYFARIPDYLNVDLLRGQLVVVVGLGMVGSPIAEELARCTVGRFRFIDHDPLEEENLARHVLPDHYLGWNKAEAMAAYLSDQIDGLATEPIPRKIDSTVSQAQLDKWLADADLVIAATDDRTAQRRVMQSALALDIPALAPALYVPNGGEIIFQGGWELPCFGCWDYFRTNDEQLRGARALGFIAWPVIHTTIDLSLGILDPLSGHGQIMTEARGQPPNQIFTLDRLGTLDRAPGTRRPTCPACGGGPAPSSEFSGIARPAEPHMHRARAPRPTAHDDALVRPTPSFGALWIIALGVGAVLIAVIVLAKSGGSTAPVVPTPTRPHAPRPVVAPLPRQARTDFDVAASYEAAGSTASGEEKAPISDNALLHYTVTPVVQGFVMYLKVRVVYTPSGAAKIERGLANAVGATCVDVNVQRTESGGDTYKEPPLESHLTVHGLVVSGSLAYPAALPGAYSYDPACAGDARQGNLGTVTTKNLGVSNGGGFFENALTVYKVHRARTDTAILFGVTNLHHEESYPLKNACIDASPGINSGDHLWHPSRVRVYRTRGSRTGESFELGTLIFPVGSAAIANGAVSYNCLANSPVISLAVSGEAKP